MSHLLLDKLCTAPVRVFCISGLLLLARVCIIAWTALELAMMAWRLGSFLLRSWINFAASVTMDWS